MKRLLIIGGGPSQATVIEAAKSMGLRVTVADDRPDQPGARLADELISVHRYDFDGIVSATDHLDIDGVASGGSDKAVLVAAMFAERRGLSTSITSASARLSTTKGVLRRLHREWGVMSPAAGEVGSFVEAEALAKEFGYPIVVKPVDGIGQVGVDRVDSSDALHDAIENAFSATPSRRAVLESFISGRELGVNAYVFDGAVRILTIGERVAQKSSGEAFGVATLKRAPVRISSDYAAAIRSLLETISANLGQRSGPIYAQIMLTSRGPYIIESMPRLGGGEDARLVEALTGFSMSRAVVLEALGKVVTPPPLDDPEPYSRFGVLKFLTAPPGQLRVANGIGNVLRRKGVIAAGFYVGVGAEVRPMRSTRERLGYICVVGGSAMQARRRLAAALADVEIKTEQQGV